MHGIEELGTGVDATRLAGVVTLPKREHEALQRVEFLPLSENKVLAHPASVDSLPTSANQEDHVSMATYAGRRLHTMLDNVADIVAIELLAAAQGIDFHHPQKSSPPIEEVMSVVRLEISAGNSAGITSTSTA